MTDLLIPDISEFQGVIDWGNFGSQAAIIRICYGNLHVDNQADRNIDESRKVTQARGWYCYLIQNIDPVAQAQVFSKFLQAHGGLQQHEFIVCDDEEGNANEASRITTFLDNCDALLKVANPNSEDWWYSGLNFSITHNLATAKGHRWIAAYGQSEPTVAHDLWQFTDAASLSGVNGNVDMSVFHSTITDFIALIDGGASIAMVIQDRVVPASPVSGKIFRNAQWFNWTDLTPLQMTDVTGSTGAITNWTEAVLVNNIWYDRISGGAWALKDDDFDDGNHDPTFFRPVASNPVIVPTPNPIVTPNPVTTNPIVTNATPNPDVATLTTRLAMTEANVTTLTTEVTTLTTTLSATEANVATLATSEANLTSEVATLQANVTTLTTTLQNIKAAIQ